jgi:PAS domain S-box-containing protein
MTKTASLTGLVSIRTLEKIQDNFSEATGIGCVMRDLKGEVITKYSRPSRLWMEVTKHPELEREANEMLFKAMEKCTKTGQIQIFVRYFDTTTFLVPIGLDGRIFGFMIGGLCRNSNPNIVLCTKEADRLGVDLDTFLEMYLELTLVTNERMEACAKLLRIVSSTLSNFAKEENMAKEKMNEMATLTDVLEKKVECTENELKESEERYRHLFNTIMDGAYFCDMNGIVKDINPAGAQMMGFYRGDLIGTNFRNLYVHPTDRDQFMHKILHEGQVFNFNPYIRLKNGGTKYFETNATIIKDNSGKPIGVVGIFRDISHRSHTSINQSPNHVTGNPSLKNTPDNQNAPR